MQKWLVHKIMSAFKEHEKTVIVNYMQQSTFHMLEIFGAEDSVKKIDFHAYTKRNTEKVLK